MIRIALDAMGGDYAPEQIVLGAVLAAASPGFRGTLILVGDPGQIQPYLRDYPGGVPSNILIHPAMDVITMEDKPAEAVKNKKDSSLVVACRLVKENQADAVISAGNTGAAVAASLFAFKRIKGVERPAIGCQFPNKNGRFLLLDAGASPDASPHQMVEFAELGIAYASRVMDKPNPKVHLLNIGEEPGKGNAWAKEAHDLLSHYDWFAGNVEGKDMFHNKMDVVVCDAFIGNIVLKTAEGVGEFIMDGIRSAVPQGPGKILFLPLKSALAPLRKQVDYAEYGGQPLLGLNGICIISHGRSNARAIKNAVLNAAHAVENDLVGAMKSRMEETQKGH
ncbi:MAG: phosphate acyltransferase PlsX [Fimbriimonadaceae bacterium]|nr:phosphate acyltransferase PlsX [Fimbriimonadaceae bacterium]